MRILWHRWTELLCSISSSGTRATAVLLATAVLFVTTCCSSLPAQDGSGKAVLVLPSQVESSKVAETTRRAKKTAKRFKNEFKNGSNLKSNKEKIEGAQKEAAKGAAHPFKPNENNTFEPIEQPAKRFTLPINEDASAQKVENVEQDEDNSFSPNAFSQKEPLPGSLPEPLPKSLPESVTQIEAPPFETTLPVNSHSVSSEPAGVNAATSINSDSNDGNPIIKPFFPAAMSAADVTVLPKTYGGYAYENADPNARYQDDDEGDSNQGMSLADSLDEDSLDEDSLDEDSLDEDSLDEGNLDENLSDENESDDVMGDQFAGRDPFDDQEKARHQPSEFLQLWAGRSISDISIDIRENSVVRPRDRSGELFRDGGGDWQASSTTLKNFSWVAPNIRYQPLYIEDVALERYGQTPGGFKGNAISYFHFFKSAALLPYSMLIDHPRSCDYPLGYCRPGEPTRKIIQRHWWGL